MTKVIERGDFWEFKARTTALDLEVASLRLKLATVTQLRNTLMDEFATTHGFVVGQPMTFEDSDCSVTQK